MSKIKLDDNHIHNNLIPEKQDQNTQKTYKFDQLSSMQSWGYSVGHIYNDLFACIWINYFIYYTKQIKNLPSIASISFLTGQIVDAFACIIVGILSDKTQTRWGQRTPWYFSGFILVSISYLPIYLQILHLEDEDYLIIYYVFFVFIWNIGYAAIQTPHMSLVPSLTCSRQKRDELNGRRNTFQYISNLLVLGLSLVFFKLFSSEKSIIYLCYFCYPVGILTSLIFLFTINEVKLTKFCQECIVNIQETLQLQKFIDEKGDMRSKKEPSQISKIRSIMDLLQSSKSKKGEVVMNEYQPLVEEEQNEEVFWQDWFKKPQFYQCCIIYVGARLYCTVQSSMLSFYLVLVLEFKNEEIDKTPIEVALIPLILYISSVLVSFMIDRIFKLIGKKSTFTIGIVISLCNSAILSFIDADSQWYIYPASFLMGTSQALFLNTGITLISDVIGTKGSSGAFVFGFYLLIDKIFIGVTVYVITIMPQFKDNQEFIRWVTVIVPQIYVLIAWMCAMMQQQQTKNKGDKKIGTYSEFAQ